MASQLDQQPCSCAPPSTPEPTIGPFLLTGCWLLQTGSLPASWGIAGHFGDLLESLSLADNQLTGQVSRQHGDADVLKGWLLCISGPALADDQVAALLVLYAY